MTQPVADILHACQVARAQLLAERSARGIWEGELSDSALSTALAVSALLHNPAPQADDRERMQRGVAWLLGTQLADGSWGDTTTSPGNLSTTAIAWATLLDLSANDPESPCGEPIARAAAWIQQQLSHLNLHGPQSTDPRQRLIRAITGVYGADRTFAVPILSHLAWSGTLGNDRDAWDLIPPLPFALALLPRRLFAVLHLRVVSYALPALIAIGLARHVGAAHARGRRAWGSLVRPILMRRLAKLQPGHGGFLDAAPLTAFVALGLVTAGEGGHPVAARCRDFLRHGQRANGAWPIDTNLSLWVTSLATRALTVAPADDFSRQTVEAHLLAAQHRVTHPYTGAAPGGWGWSDIPGAVPDGDDTAGALIALHRLGTPLNDAIREGLLWLAALQNRDGGIPTFCRGWGRLPFDQSCPDLTAHACAAWHAWMEQADAPLRKRLQATQRQALDYLRQHQHGDGSWHPLWFGNAGRKDCANPTLGTARVVSMLRDGSVLPAEICAALARGETWLLAAQKPDGSWGADAATPSTIEETAWGVMALARARAGTDAQAAAMKGAKWLAQEMTTDRLPVPAPIGLYFARLWYAERLYPLVWSVEALSQVLQSRRPSAIAHPDAWR
jgi:squalene-hopene/tetraprenyl-beta-curcumene cyclase